MDMSFNSDSSLMALTTTEYFATFNCVPVRRIVKENAQGGMRCIAQLHRSPVLVLVPSGDKPGTSPRRLSLWNCRTKSVIQEFGFADTVLGCAINKEFLVVGTEGALSVFELKSMSLLVKLPSRAGSVFALSDEEEASLLAFPSPSSVDANNVEGSVSVYSCRQGRLVSQVNAHKTAVSVLSFNPQGTHLASASVTGSIIRVFQVPEGTCVHVFRHSVPTPLTLFAFPSSSADQHAADKRVSCVSFCPRGHFLLSVTSPSGAKGGYVNVFRVGGLPDALPISNGGEGVAPIGRDADDDTEYCTVEARDLPPALPLASDRPAASNDDDEASSGENGGAAGSAWASWQQLLQAQAAVQLRSLQALSQDYLATGTAAARAAAVSMGASAMAAAGTMPLMYARIHSAESAPHSHGTDDAQDRMGAGGGAGSRGSRDRTSGAADGQDDGSGSGASHSKGVSGVKAGREGPSFFAALNYVAVDPQAAAETPATNLALNVITAVGGIYRRYVSNNHFCLFLSFHYKILYIIFFLILFFHGRYNVSFLQARSGDEGVTVSLSDTKPASSAGALPQTLSELLEDECALLE